MVGCKSLTPPIQPDLSFVISHNKRQKSVHLEQDTINIPCHQRPRFLLCWLACFVAPVSQVAVAIPSTFPPKLHSKSSRVATWVQFLLSFPKLCPLYSPRGLVEEYYGMTHLFFGHQHNCPWVHLGANSSEIICHSFIPIIIEY